jgi:hypothetical protein
MKILLLIFVGVTISWKAGAASDYACTVKVGPNYDAGFCAPRVGDKIMLDLANLEGVELKFTPLQLGACSTLGPSEDAPLKLVQTALKEPINRNGYMK